MFESFYNPSTPTETKETILETQKECKNHCDLVAKKSEGEKIKNRREIEDKENYLRRMAMGVAIRKAHVDRGLTPFNRQERKAQLNFAMAVQNISDVAEQAKAEMRECGEKHLQAVSRLSFKKPEVQRRSRYGYLFQI